MSGQIYTKNGDKGTTSLVHSKNLSKSDDRICLVGTIDELTSHLGLVRSMMESEPETAAFLTGIQKTLMTIMAGVADPYKKDYRIDDEEVLSLEREIDRLEALFERPRHFIIPGDHPLSARIDVARTVARRAERALALVSVRFGAESGSKRYMNRLADYLYILARYEDAVLSGRTKKEAPAAVPQVKEPGVKQSFSEEDNGMQSETVIREVMRRMGRPEKITLEEAKRMIQRVEERAAALGKKAAVAVCGPDGNPIAAHAMDGVFFISFDLALKKAYTAAAVHMSTLELSRISQPGETFYGLSGLQEGRMVVFGGGVPIYAGDTLIGALGVSGGTGEEDHALAAYGAGMD